MAIVKGTNAGFVTSSPSADPAASDNFEAAKKRSLANKDVTPAQDVTITEIGWWCDNTGDDVNYEVGIYSHDSTNNVADELLSVSRTNAKGTTAGWKKVTGLNISLNASTTYWIAIQCDDDPGGWATCDLGYMGSGSDDKCLYTANDGADATLLDTWPATSSLNKYLWAIYAVYEEEEEEINAVGTGYNWSVGNGAVTYHNLVYATGQGFGWSVGQGAVTNILLASATGYNWSVGTGAVTYYNIIAVTGQAYNWSVGEGKVANILIATGQGFNWSYGRGIVGTEFIVAVEGEGFNWSVGNGDITYFNIIAVDGQGYNWSVGQGIITNILLGTGQGFNWSFGSGYAGEVPLIVTALKKVTGGRVRKKNLDFLFKSPQLPEILPKKERIPEIVALETHLKSNKVRLL